MIEITWVGGFTECWVTPAWKDHMSYVRPESRGPWEEVGWIKKLGSFFLLVMRATWLKIVPRMCEIGVNENQKNICIGGNLFHRAFPLWRSYDHILVSKNIRLTLGSLFFFSLFHCEQLEFRPFHYYRLKISLVLYHRQSPGWFWSTLCCCHPPNTIMSSKGFQIILKGIYRTGMSLCAIVCLCLCPDWMWNRKTSISLTGGARLMEVLEGRLSRVHGLANPGGEPPITLGFRFSRHAPFIHLTFNPDLRTMIWWYGDTILDI